MFLGKCVCTPFGFENPMTFWLLLLPLVYSGDCLRFTPGCLCLLILRLWIVDYLLAWLTLCLPLLIFPVYSRFLTLEFCGVGGLIDDINLETDTNNKMPKRTLEILANCHALVFVDNKLVGDPPEKAAIHWIDNVIHLFLFPFYNYASSIIDVFVDSKCFF